MADSSVTPETICRRHELLEQILARLEVSVEKGFTTVNDTLKEVAKDLREGAVEMATMKLRIQTLERLVFGAIAIALSGLGLALFDLIVNK